MEGRLGRKGGCCHTCKLQSCKPQALPWHFCKLWVSREMKLPASPLQCHLLGLFLEFGNFRWALQTELLGQETWSPQDQLALEVGVQLILCLWKDDWLGYHKDISFFKNCIIYFWLCWVFIGVRTFSSCGGREPLFISMCWLLLWNMGSRACGLQ